MTQLFVIAARNLTQHSKRTLLLGGAIACVAALLMILQSLASGMQHAMLDSATTLTTGHINIAGFYKVTPGQSSAVITHARDLEVIAKDTLKDLTSIHPRGRGWGKVVSETGSIQGALVGVDIETETQLKQRIQVSSGSIHSLSEPGTILIFEDQAKKLEVKVGDSLVISATTSRGVSNTLDARIVAIAKDMGLLSQWAVLIPNLSMRLLNQISSESSGALQLYLKDMSRVSEDLNLLRMAFEKKGYLIMDRVAQPFWVKFASVNREDWTGQKLDLTSWEDETSFLKWTLSAVDGLTVTLTVVLLSIIGVGIMNSMWIAIRERTREIGTLRAIGMQRSWVMALFLIESFLLGLCGTLVGTVLGLSAAALMHLSHIPVPKGAQFFVMSQTLQFSVDWTGVLTGFVVITACTTLISIFPSFHAARLKPITAMQHIG